MLDLQAKQLPGSFISRCLAAEKTATKRPRENAADERKARRHKAVIHILSIQKQFDEVVQFEPVLGVGACPRGRFLTSVCFGAAEPHLPYPALSRP